MLQRQEKYHGRLGRREGKEGRHVTSRGKGRRDGAATVLYHSVTPSPTHYYLTNMPCYALASLRLPTAGRKEPATNGLKQGGRKTSCEGGISSLLQ